MAADYKNSLQARYKNTEKIAQYDFGMVLSKRGTEWVVFVLLPSIVFKSLTILRNTRFQEQ